VTDFADQIFEAVDADGLEMAIDIALCQGYTAIENAVEAIAEEIESLILDHWWGAELGAEVDKGLAMTLYTKMVKDALFSLLRAGPLTGLVPEDDLHDKLTQDAGWEYCL